MERVTLLAAAFPLAWVAMVACGTGGSPVQPAAAVENLPIARASQPLTGARSLTAGVLAEEDLSELGIDDASCPKVADRPLTIYMPCRHFNFVAPSTGTLRVSVTWDNRTEAVALVVGEIEADAGFISGTGLYRYANPKVIRVRVEAGQSYRVTGSLVTSHLDFLGWLAGPFQLIATIE